MKINLAARAGRWSAAHRKTAIWGWVALVLATVVVGGALGTKTLNDDQSGVGESARADKTLDKAFPGSSSEDVLVQSRHAKADDPSFREAVADVQRRLGELAFVRHIQAPYERGSHGRISKDGHSALVGFEIPDNSHTSAEDKVPAALKTVAAAERAHPGFRIEEFGGASADRALSKSFEDDFRKAEVSSLPITLAILVVVFGALVAAGVPLLLALTAVAATIGLIGPLSHLSPVAEQIGSVVLLIGLAVGVDYSMFYLRREREERAAGKGERASLEAAAATSGRAILVSGFTVMVAMAGMYIAGDPTFASFATGTILVVAVAMVGSLTVLPALLAWLGDRVEKGHVPFVRKLRPNGGGMWSALVDRVMRRPLVAGGIATALLVTLAIPAFGLHTADSGASSLPQDIPVVKTYDRIQAAFPGSQESAEVVVSGRHADSPAVRAGIERLRERVQAEPGSFGRPVEVDVSPDRSVADVSVPLAGNGTDARSNAALAKLRHDVVPRTIGAVPGVKAETTGDTAGSKDFTDLLKQRMPLVFAFVLAAAFLLLLVTFRSLVIPLTAIVLNLLSVGAAYGLVVWVFQDGHLEGPLGFHSNGAITSWLPLFLFVVLFGLSMDYHVFILSRIREAYDRGMPTERAVAHGVKTTAGVVTSAAAVMVAVFGIFATLSFLDFKEMGVGLAAAILIDATIIRAVLLPAAMKLLGDRNWYLPRRLRWLPRVGEQGSPRPSEARA
ncbi:MAG TPA: MMPL family transporter [Thermoleophilaceae bacterium]|jgi:RND superfamily putative drug exporter